MRRLILPLLLAACGGDDGPPGTDDTDVAANTAPVAEITDPGDGDTVADASAVRLEGRGTDAEDGTLGDDALAWSSDRDGALGTGALLTVALSVGTHALTLTATDAGGATGTDTVTLVVAGENAPPVPVILAPDDGAVVREGSALDLEGAADDREDGSLSGASLVWASSIDGLLGTGARVSVPSPSLGEHVVTLTAVDGAGAEASTSITVTVAPVGSNLAPRVTITTPLDGASVPSAVDLTLAGTATDPEDGPVTSGLVWEEVGVGTIASGNGTATFTPSPGVHTLRLTATDSQGLDGSASVTITANPPGNSPPEVTLTAPTNGATVTAGADLSVAASATDAEDGTLGDAALAWSSDRDGALGTGRSRVVRLTTLGRHALTVTATDTGGAVDVASVDVFVLAPNQPPVATITGPASGSRYVAGTVVRFVGTGVDPEDGALTGSALAWASSIQGALGTGSPLDTGSLVAGTHTVTLTAIDGGGRVGTDQIQVVVDPAVVNLPPVAVISASPTASVDLPWALDASGSTDPDGTITSYAVDWGDGSARSSGASASLVHTYVAEGTFTATLTVTDDDGATDDASAQVVVSIPPRVPEIAADLGFDAGAWCSLALDAQERPWVAFAEVEHDQVWLARRSSTRPSGTWTVELVAGPGFGVGGLHGGTGELVLDGSGDAHLGFTLEETVHYARRTAAGAWTVEALGAGVAGGHVGVALDAAAGGMLSLAFTRDDAGTDRVVVMRRTSPGTWTTSTTAQSTGDWTFTGGWALGALGGALVVHERSSWNVKLVPWTGTGFGSAVQVDYLLAPSLPRRHAAASPDGRVHVALSRALWTRSGGTLTESVVANQGSDDLAVAWDPTRAAPALAFRNEAGQLEIQQAVGVDLWEPVYEGPMDRTTLDVAVTAAGEVRTCFFRDGRLVVY